MPLYILLFIYLIGLLNNKTVAAVLLVPSAETQYTTYTKQCTKPGYLCITDYFLSVLKYQKSPEFDRLIDSVDFNSALFINELHEKTVNILNTENLSRRQLSLLISLLQQAQTRRSLTRVKNLIQELIQIQLVLNNSITSENEKIVSIFKETLTLQEAEKIKTRSVKIPVYILHFSSIPHRTDTMNLKVFAHKPLLLGPCGESQLKYKIEILKYCGETTK